jgi:alanyl aminopeptidase
MTKLSYTALALALLGCAPAVSTPSPPRPSASEEADAIALEDAPKGRLGTSVTPLGYALDLEVDPSTKGYGGTVKIDVSLAEPRRRVHLHGRDKRVTKATFRDAQGKVTDLTARALDDRALLELESKATLPAGRGQIEIVFESPFAKSLSGIYRVDAGGASYAFSQMEPLDARRAFPCFDEPSFKVPFTVSLVVRETDQAISNARATGEAPAGPGKKRVTFATTEKLPTYLVAFAVGPFDVVEAKPIPASAVRKTPLPLRGVAVKGKGPLLGFALERHAALVTELERYFGIAYPYDKLDVIAVPDFSAGAMENAGAITYRDMLLLVDPKTVTESQRRDVVGVAAHELAHQWFGNLVTMMWWDDIWLNEAFATSMGQRAVRALYPDWNVDLESLAWVHEAMEVDSVASARAIRQKIVTDDDVENAFDPLTYSKGGGLIAMYERYVGEEKFRQGVRRYLEKHRFGNANADDFLTAVFADRPELAASFRGFLDKPGVPRVDVAPRCQANAAELSVSVSRYVPLGSSATSDGAFAVPLCARAANAKSPACGLVGQGDGASKTLPMASAECPAWVFPNADGAAYARWTPSAEAIRSLFDKGYGALGAGERLALADSLRAGLFAGTLGTNDVLGALPKLAADPVRDVAFAASGTLELLREELAAPADRKKIEDSVVKLYGPRAKRLGWEAKPGESADEGLQRAATLELLAQVGRDTATRKEALRRARVWLGLDKATKGDALEPDLRALALVIAVQDGGKEVWEATRAKLDSTDDALLRRHLLAALSSATTDQEAQRSRALVFDDVLRSGEVLRYTFNLAGVAEQRTAFWDWLKRELPRLKDRVPDGARGYVPSLTESFCDAKLIPDVRATFEPHLAAMLGAPRSLENAAERIAICSAVKAKVRAAR